MRRTVHRLRPRRRASPALAAGGYGLLMLAVFAVTLGWFNRDGGAPPMLLAPAPTIVNDLDMTAPIPAATISFGLCHSGGDNCVVDGDTFWLNGEKIRIADIDTPETHPPRCAREAALGERATLRLQQLLNAGPINLSPAASGDNHDRYGRRLAVVERGGTSIGMMLVGEGLARRYRGGQRAGWC